MMADYSVRSRTDIPRSFFDNLERAALEKMRPVLQDIAEEIRQEAIKITLASGMVTNRPPSRRRHPDAKHFHESWEIGATDLSGGRIRLTIRNNHPFAEGINNGSPAHTIKPKAESPWNYLRFPYATTGEGGSQYATDTAPYKKIAEVSHPGSEGFGIREQVTDWARIAVRAPDVRVRLRTSG